MADAYVRMTWPQHQRREIEIGGVRVYLRPKLHMMASVLVMRPGIVSHGDLIEAIWPDPDFEPDHARNLLHVYANQLRARGVPVIEHWGRGFELKRIA